MKGQGAHIILTREDAKRVFAVNEDSAVRQVVTELRHSKRHRESKLVLETGSAWDVIHRFLTEGTLDRAAGEFPLNHTILGGKRLHQGADFEAVMVRPDIVPHVAEALHNLKRTDAYAKYQQINAEEFGTPLTEKDFDIAWNTLQQIRQLYEDAATERCAVLFTVER